jgi:hypothetical protein
MQSIHRQFRSLSRSLLLTAAVSLLCLTVPTGAMAQSSDVSKVISTVAAVIPQQVRYMGAFANRGGDTVEATFRIYATAEGGEALWTETQQVAVKADGSYSVLLGAASESGLPQGVFAGGQARWLGVSIDSAESLPRTALSSVAYAMKAGDAETVGGVAAANLVTKDDLAKMSQASTTAVQSQTAVQTGLEPATNPTGSGTADYVALWTTSGNLGNSNIFQASSGFLGVGTTTPGGPLQLSTGATGGANATMMLTQTSAASGNYYADIGLYNSKGLIGNLSALGAGYPSGNLFVANDVVFLGGQQNAGTNLIFLTNTSGALKFGTGGFAVANERMRIGAAGGVSVGNSYVGTDPGAGNLIVSGKVGVGTKTPAAILEVNGTAKFDGLVTFGSGQTFPGTGKGTITGVTASSPLTGGGTSGTVTVGLNTTTLGTTLESTYDNRYAQLVGPVQFSDFVSAGSNEGSGYFALYGIGSNGSGGVNGQSDTGVAVSGISYGNAVTGFSSAPVGGQAGVFGTAASSSAIGTDFTELIAGVWGDTGVDSSGMTYYGIGVIGTADDGNAGGFFNNSNNYSTLDVYNLGTAGLGSAGRGTPVGLFSTIKASSATGTCGIGGGSMSCTGPIKSLVSTAGSRTVETYAMQSPENWMEDFGSGSVVNGHATVSIDPAFAEMVSGDANYKVFLTPNGDSKGLYVTAKTANGFEVRESSGGTSSLSFDYRIVAKRAGYEAQRMVDVSETFKRETSTAGLFKPKGSKTAAAVHPRAGAEVSPAGPHPTIVPRPAPRRIAPQATAVPAKQQASK